MSYFDVIGDEKELYWFFKHILKKPNINESYSLILSARFKKLTEEEKNTYGISRKTAEFLRTEIVKNKTFHNEDYEKEKDNLWTWEHFLKSVYKLNCDKRGYLTDIGSEIPDKCLTTMITINPADDIKIADEILRTINDTKTNLLKSTLNGKEIKDNIAVYQTFGQLERHFRTLHANMKGSVYYLDIDVDVPSWFDTNCRVKMIRILNSYFKEGAYQTYAIVKTSGGYHILINTKKIKFNPNNICKDITNLYEDYVSRGFERYLDDKGNEKFEAKFSSNSIPMVVLAGTYQYGNIVRVINKNEFTNPPKIIEGKELFWDRELTR